jgi:hypothetical protein
MKNALKQLIQMKKSEVETKKLPLTNTDTPGNQTPGMPLQLLARADAD